MPRRSAANIEAVGYDAWRRRATEAVRRARAIQANGAEPGVRATMGERLRAARDGPRPEPARARGSRSACRRASSPRSRPGARSPSVNTLYALADRARRLARRPAVHRRGPPAVGGDAERWTAPGDPEAPVADRSRMARSSGARSQADPARLRCRLGAAHDRVDPGHRLPPRDLRGRRRLEPGARVPAPRRPRVGLRPERHASRVTIGFDDVRPRPGRRHLASTRRPRTGCQRRDEPVHGDLVRPRPARRPTSRARRARDRC